MGQYFINILNYTGGTFTLISVKLQVGSIPRLEVLNGANHFQVIFHSGNIFIFQYLCLTSLPVPDATLAFKLIYY